MSSNTRSLAYNFTNIVLRNSFEACVQNKRNLPKMATMDKRRIVLRIFDSNTKFGRIKAKEEINKNFVESPLSNVNVNTIKRPLKLRLLTFI